MNLNADKPKHPELSFKSQTAPAPFEACDSKIWQAFKSGSESAFIQIYETHYSNLVTYGVNFTRDRDLVKDCIQDMFLELRENRAKLSDTDKIKPWLYKIFRRKIIRYMEKRDRFVHIDGRRKDLPFDITISHEQHLINRQIDEDQLRKLNGAIKKLTAKEREAIFHFYFELYSYREIAEIMGYSQVKTARTLVYKALSSLRHTLESNTFLYFFFF